jgi:hypothetical protein
MPATTIAFDLEDPPERVFDYVADSATSGAGRRTSSGWRRRALVFLGEGPRMWLRFAMDVAARDGGGSHVTFAVDMRPQGAFKLFSPLLSLGLPREVAKRPQQFREALAADPA